MTVDDVLTACIFRLEAALLIGENCVVDTSAKALERFQMRLPAVSRRNVELKSNVPRCNTGEHVWTFAEPWKGRRGLEERPATRCPVSVLTVAKSSQL